MSEENRRLDWDDNHFTISEAYFEIAKENKKRPTLKEISERTDLSVKTIQKHLNDLSKLKFEERFKDLKLMSASLLMAMYNQGAKGKAGCAKLFFQIVEQFSEKSDVHLTGDALRNMSVSELEEKLKELEIPNRSVKTDEPVSDDDREAAAEND